MLSFFDILHIFPNYIVLLTKKHHIPEILVHVYNRWKNISQLKHGSLPYVVVCL